MKCFRALPGILLAASLSMAGAVRAEVGEIRIAKQFGIVYLPLFVMESQKLVEKHGKAQGLDRKSTRLNSSH